MDEPNRMSPPFLPSQFANLLVPCCHLHCLQAAGGPLQCPTAVQRTAHLPWLCGAAVGGHVHMCVHGLWGAD